MKDENVLTSELLFAKLKEFEGLRLKAYQDAAGVWTIGYGHTHNVRRGDVISQFYAEEMLRLDILQCQRQVLRLGVCTTQGQLDALVSFVLNMGIGRLQKSTLLGCIRQHQPQGVIREQFLRWVYGGGRRLPGLVKRRTWECQRFFEEDSPQLQKGGRDDGHA